MPPEVARREREIAETTATSRAEETTTTTLTLVDYIEHFRLYSPKICRQSLSSYSSTTVERIDTFAEMNHNIITTLKTIK